MSAAIIPTIEPQRALMVRVGIDASYGRWNAPVDRLSRAFVYVPIPETRRSRPGLRLPYQALKAKLHAFGTPLPKHLNRAAMHLDPDFAQLSYGDQGRKGQRISQLEDGDLLVFYAGLRDRQQPEGELVYAIIGLYVVAQIIPALTVAEPEYHRNAHTRFQPRAEDRDLIVHAHANVSGRLSHCLPIGSRRLACDQSKLAAGTKRLAPMYRVLPELLDAWGGMSNNDGYLQRSAVPPELLDPRRFYRWFLAQNVTLLAEN